MTLRLILEHTAILLLVLAFCVLGARVVLDGAEASNQEPR